MNWNFIPTIHRIGFVLLLLSAMFFSHSSTLQAQQCPIVQAFPLQDVAGFPQTDSLVLCGVADTLAVLIFPSPEASYPNGLNVTFEFPAGMQYAGFSGLTFPGPTVSEGDVSDVENPTFLIEGIGPGQAIVLFIGVEANCELVPPEDAPVNMVIDYVADQAGQLAACRDEIRPLAEYNSAYRIPVVNIIGGAPVVNGECVLTFEDFSAEYCDTLIISQDGIEAYLDSFNLYVDGLALGPDALNLERIEMNGMNFPLGDFAYDATSMSGQLTVTENFFTGNFDPNGESTENDLDFNVNEQLTAVFCFTANDCGSVAGSVVTFGATYNCYERQCFEPSEKEVALQFNPAFSPEPLATATVIQEGGICGDDFIVEFEVSSALGGMEGLYQDLRLLIPLCGGAEGIDGDDPMLTGLETIDVSIFNYDTGMFVPQARDAEPDEVWQNVVTQNYINIDFNGPSFDVDGASGGLADIDGDGLWDDLPGDETLRFQVTYAFVCSDQASRQESSACGALACSVENIEVRGLRSCGQSFQQTATIAPEPLNYYYGGILTTSNAGPTGQLDFGYQIGGVGAASPQVDPGEMGAEVTFTATHGYQFLAENITGCANAETSLELYITGANTLVRDVEIASGSVGYYDNGTLIPIPDSDVNIQNLVLAPGDTSVIITIDAGGVGNPFTEIDSFTYDLAFDECLCSPRIGTVSARILESCPDCDTECSVVKSCISYNVYINSTGCNCITCPLQAEVVDVSRLTTGYSDKSMSTRLDISEIADIDKSRFLPGDTAVVVTKYTINDIEWFNQWATYLNFDLNHVPLTEGAGGAVDPNDVEMRQLPAIMNTDRSSIRSISIQRAGSSTSSLVSLPYDLGGGCIQFTRGALDIFPLTMQGATIADNDAVRTSTSGNNYADNNTIEFRIGNLNGDGCLDGFKADNVFQEGDMIFLEYWIAMQPNPGQQRNLPELQGSFSAAFQGVTLNPAPVPNQSGNSQCALPTPYDFYNPGPVGVSQDVTLTQDGCFVDVKHTYALGDDVPDTWYENEFRTISGLAFTNLTIPPNLAYCGPMNILDMDGNVIGTVPDEQISFPNMTQVSFGGTDYYIANPGQATGTIQIEDAEFSDGAPILNQGTSWHLNATTIDPVAYAAGDNTLVGGTFPLLGVGFQSEQCNFMLSYQLKRICQENVDATQFTNVLGSSYTTTENYLVDSEYWSRGNTVGSQWTGLNMEVASLWVEGNRHYWPYSATRFNNFGEADFGNLTGNPNPTGNATVVDADGDGKFDNIYGVTFNPHNQLDTLLLPNFVDNSANFPSLVVSTDFNLIADAQDAPDCNFYEVCAGADGGADLENMVSTVEVPAAVALESIVDQFGNGLAFTLISTTANTTTYQITHQGDGLVLSPGECYRMEICTELLFCPIGLDIPTNINVSSTASCLSADLSALLTSTAEGACLESGTEYEYISEEADLQGEFFIPDGMFDEIGLCDEFCIAARVKNVKTSTLIDLSSFFFLPNGLEFVAGSWEISYPGGPNAYTNAQTGDDVDLQDCADSDAWESIPDPTESTPTRPRGTTYTYNWQDDILGEGNGVLDNVISNGLPGVSTETAINDLNKVAFRFRVRTICDEFTSGTSVRFINSALDPCESTILSNLSITDPIIINDADPVDFAQLLTVADPPNINCGEMGSLNISTINTSQTAAVTLNARQCINIPTNGITYQTGSLIFIEPAGFDAMAIETDVFGADGVTVIEKEICFNVPDNLMPGEFYQIAFDFELTQDVSCDEGEISVEIATVLEDQQCADTGTSCSLAVLNSINPVFAIDFLPPLDVEEFKVISACDNDPNTIVYAYMFDLENPGPDFMNSIEIDIIRDLDQDGMLDNFELDAAINPVLGGPITVPVNLAMGESTSLMGEINVPTDIGCPAFFRLRQNSDCACDEVIRYIDSAEPEFFADLSDEVVLCPGSPLMLDVCGDYEPSAGNDYVFTNGNGRVVVNFMGNTVLSLQSDPLAAIDFSLSGDEVVATLNDDFGTAGAVDINLTVNQGFCQETYTVNVRSAPDLTVGPFETKIVCTGDKAVLDLGLDAILEANATITWSPTTFLDDPTSPKPIICNPTSDIQYTVTVELNDSEMGCSGMAMYDVQVLMPGIIDLTYTGETVCYDEDNPGVLTAQPGFVNYEFFVLVSGNEFTVQNGTSNIYNVPGPGGTYFVRVDDGSACGLASSPVSAPGLTCGECPDIYNGITPLEVCAGDALDSIKVFTGSTAIDGIAFVIFDTQQLNPIDVYNYASTGGNVLGSATGMIMGMDTMATIYDVTVPTTAGDYFIYGILNPTPIQMSCRPVEEIVLNVNPLPIAGMAMMEACEDENGMASFVLSDNDNDIDIAGGNTVTYHLTSANAQDNVNPVTSNPYITGSDITLYARVENAQGCFAVGELVLMANQLPLTPISGGDQVYCDGDTPPAVFVQNPGTGFTVEWFTDATANTPISGVTVGGFNNESITLSATSNPALPTTGNSVSVYAQVRDDATNCISAMRTEIMLINNPRPMASPAAMTVCENEFQSRIGTFDLTTLVDDVNADFMEGGMAAGGIFTSMNGMMELSFHTSMTDAMGDVNPQSAPESFMNTSLGGQTLFVRVENEVACFNIVQIQLSVAGQPDADNLNFTVCPDIGSETTSSGIDLTGLEGTIASGNTPGSYSVTWFVDATLTTPISTPTNVSVIDGSTFYALIEFNTAPNCSNVGIVTYEVDPLPETANIDLELCEDEALVGDVANISLRDNDLSVANGMSAIVNWYKDMALTMPVPNPTSVTLNIGGNGTEDNIFYAEVSDGNCSNRAVLNYTIFEQPVPIPAGPYEVCAESTLMLNSASLGGSATMGAWTITDMPMNGDGAVMPMGLQADLAAANFTATVPGDYTLTLTTNDPDGPCLANSADVIVTVHPLPVATPPMAEICIGNTVTVDGTPSEGTAPYVSHTWTDLGTGTASGYSLMNTDQQIVIIDASTVPINAGAGTVDLEYTVVDSNGCTDSGTTTIIIHPLPIPNPMEQMLCVGDMVSVDGNPSQGTTPYMTHAWTDLGTGTASNYVLIGADMQIVSIDASMTMDSEAGTVDLEYMVTDVNGCSQSETVTVTINPLPEITPIDGNITCDPPQEVQISASTTAVSPTYTWDGPGIIAGGDTNAPTVNLPGVYTVIVTDGVTGCTNTAQVFVTQDPLSKCLPATFEIKVKGGE